MIFVAKCEDKYLAKKKMAALYKLHLIALN